MSVSKRKKTSYTFQFNENTRIYKVKQTIEEN